MTLRFNTSCTTAKHVTVYSIIGDVYTELMVHKLTMIFIKSIQWCLGNTVAPRRYISILLKAIIYSQVQVPMPMLLLSEHLKRNKAVHFYSQPHYQPLVLYKHQSIVQELCGQSFLWYKCYEYLLYITSGRLVSVKHLKVYYWIKFGRNIYCSS